MHWFNAACWFFLLATGLGLIKNTELNPIGGWWPNLMRSLFGSGEALFTLHVWCGLIWAGLFILYIIVRIRKEVVPFIKQIFTFSPRNDLLWVIKKGIQMTMGYKMLEKLRFETKLPDQGFYNVGQKLFAIPAVLGGTLIVATGIIMLCSKLYDLDNALVQWSILIHFVVVGIVTAGLLVHIFMAAIASGEFPALVSMFTGTVPEAYARHHHKLWYDEVKGQKKL
jgi:formate dehydrogenase subunit gamma